MKRKRAFLPNVANPDGNYTPSDSDSDSDADYQPIQRKIVRIRSNNGSDVDQPNVRNNHVVDGESSSDDSASNSSDASATTTDRGNSQLLFAAMRKIQELENELAELNEADYDSGHHDEDDIDEGNASDFDEIIQRGNHNHLNEIVDEEAEALGFAFCVKETFDYLAAEGVTNDNPIVKALRERFLDQCDSV